MWLIERFESARRTIPSKRILSMIFSIRIISQFAVCSAVGHRRHVSLNDYNTTDEVKRHINPKVDEMARTEPFRPNSIEDRAWTSER